MLLPGLAINCMSPQLCSDPLNNDKRLFQAINQMLRPLRMDPADYMPTLQEIDRLLEQQPCVRLAEFDETIIASEPALVYGRLTLGAGDQVIIKKLTLRFSGQKIWLEKIE